jgi:hypothetical protein
MLGGYGQECQEGLETGRNSCCSSAIYDSIISQQVNAAEAQTLVHWAFVPHPPLLHAVTWKDPSISVFPNESKMVGGHSSGHLVATFTNYNFTGQAVALPICLGNLLIVSLSCLFGKVLCYGSTQFLDKI